MKKSLMLFLILMLAGGTFLTACSATTTTAMCAYIVGDGTYDSKVHKILYPGQQVPTTLANETINYVPCNSRNYIINDGTVTNANGDKMGDRFTLIKATTSTGVPITIAARALWTLNEDDVAMKAFWNVCFKYNCANTKDESGTANFSTPGWNGMLAENFGPAMDAAGRDASILSNDDIWMKHDPKQYAQLGDAMSAVFAEKVRQNLGYPQDLFCGSGNSTWKDPTNPGAGSFTCSPVRIIVDDVERQPVSAQDTNSTAGQQAINAQRLSNAQALYGPDAGYWLGLQDTIDECKKTSATCIFNIGGSNGSPVISLPSATEPPVPTPTATKAP